MTKFLVILFCVNKIPAFVKYVIFWGFYYLFYYFNLDQNYGIFHIDQNDPSKSQWLESERTLEFYGFENGVSRSQFVLLNKHKL